MNKLSFIRDDTSNSLINTPLIINKLLELDHSNPQAWCKWKDNANQIVIMADHYVYKIYSKGQHWLHENIVKELASIYNSWGIHWKIFISTDENGKQIIIEQREKLEVITQNSGISLNDIMNDWSNTLIELENRLRLPIVSKYIRIASHGEIWNLKIIRDCLPKHIDYAKYKDHIVLLDDADFFICPLDKNGNWISAGINYYDLSEVYGENIQMVPLNMEFTKICPNNKSKYWQIRNVPDNEHDAVDKMLSMREQVLSRTIGVLANKSTDEIDPLRWCQYEDDPMIKFTPINYNQLIE